MDLRGLPPLGAPRIGLPSLGSLPLAPLNVGGVALGNAGGALQLATNEHVQPQPLQQAPAVIATPAAGAAVGAATIPMSAGGAFLGGGSAATMPPMHQSLSSLDTSAHFLQPAIQAVPSSMQLPVAAPLTQAPLIAAPFAPPASPISDLGVHACALSRARNGSLFSCQYCSILIHYVLSLVRRRHPLGHRSCRRY